MTHVCFYYNLLDSLVTFNNLSIIYYTLMRFLLLIQATMASDFSIAQFCYLERLLLVHGSWCYKRIAHMVYIVIAFNWSFQWPLSFYSNGLKYSFSLFFSQICYFFYKNIHFGFTLFYYEVYAAFSAQAAYNDWYMSLFNVFFTSLPVIALGVLEQDVSARVKLQVRVIKIS